MKWNKCKAKCCLSAVLAVASLLFLVSGRSIAEERRHQDGAIYCVCAGNVQMTTEELETFKKEGNLEETIQKRSEPLIRILGSMEVYEGGMESMDTEALTALSVTSGSETAPVMMYVKAEHPEEGFIEIDVTVTYVEPEPETEIPESQKPESQEPEAAEPETPSVSDKTESQPEAVKPKEPAQEMTQPQVTVPEAPKEQEEVQMAADLEVPSGKLQPSKSGRASKSSQEKSEAPKYDADEKKTSDMSLADTALAGGCALSALLYTLSLIPDFRLIRWYNRRKRRR